MRAGSDNHDPRLDENDPVWQLLAKAPRPEPDGWFTARTLSRCHRVAAEMESGRRSFWRLWRWALGGGLAACLAAVLMVSHVQVRPGPTDAANQSNVQEAFTIVASIGSDSDSSSTPSTWQDSSL